jgi:hypothetical protein
MENLLFFGLGFIACKLVSMLRLQFNIYTTRKKVRSRWVKANYNNPLIYNKNQVI